MFDHISQFIVQSHTTNLKTSQYPKEYHELDVKFSFGMGTPAKISWASIHNNEIRNTKGINCVYLYYKDKNILILAYGIMESFVGGKTWTSEVSENKPTISDYFEKSSLGKPDRYGDSFVYRVYKTEIKNNQVSLKNHETGNGITKANLHLLH